MFAASYSNTEHEVPKVTSRCGVTVTYDLYLVDSISNLRVASGVSSVLNLQTTFRRLLKNLEFLPHGGTLGFGLAHFYPVSIEPELQAITNYLESRTRMSTEDVSQGPCCE